MIRNLSIPTINDTLINKKRVLIRIDLNVSFGSNGQLSDNFRLKAVIPTLKKLASTNKCVLISHLGRPNGTNPSFSLSKVLPSLQKLIPSHRIRLVAQFKNSPMIHRQKWGELILLENVRFHPGEEKNDDLLSRELSKLGDIFVNDAFSDSHRNHASIVGIPRYLNSFAGLLIKSEVEALQKVYAKSKRPRVAIIGGAKISSKMSFLHTLLEKFDFILMGGGVANTFLKARGAYVGGSLYDEKNVDIARKILHASWQKPAKIVLPCDVTASKISSTPSHILTCSIDALPSGSAIYDIGPETESLYGKIISAAKTVIWSGPMGMFEHKAFSRGTNFIYYSLVHNKSAYKVVGGGDTIASVSNERHLKSIDHISTGGSAMIEFLEKETLPGLEALKQTKQSLLSVSRTPGVRR